MTEPRRKRAPRLEFAARRAQLLRVADDLLRREGSDALRMDRLATAAGVTRPVVYEHFRSREGLLSALIEEYGSYATSRAEEAFQSCDGLVPGLCAAFGAFLDGVQERGPGLAMVLYPLRFGPEIESASRRIRRAGIAHWASHIRSQTKLGPRRAEAVATCLVGALLALSDQMAEGALSRRLVEQTYRGLVESLLPDPR